MNVRESGGCKENIGVHVSPSACRVLFLAHRGTIFASYVEVNPSVLIVPITNTDFADVNKCKSVR